MSLRFGLLSSVAAGLLGSMTFGAATAPAQAPSLTLGTPAGPAPTATPSATAAPATPVEASPQVKEFEALKKQYTELREQLFAAQIDYKNAKADERKPIAEKFDKLYLDGEQLLSKVVKAAATAYASDPKNVSVSNFLAAYAQASSSADRYEDALSAAETLINGNYDNKRIYSIAGRAAFSLNEFDKAEKYFKIAQAGSALDLRGERYLENIPAYKTLWQKEQEIRAAEAKADDLPRVSFKTTKGEIVLELFENEAPQTVGNFVNLVEKGFYNGLSFHRVIGEFMAQAGDPNGDGTGGPGYDILCECYKPEKRLHFRGSLSMAHRGRDTGGSQFFITFLPTANLDGTAVDPKNPGGSHTVFGRVIEGIDVLAKLQRREPSDPHSSFSSKPTTPLPADKIVEAKVVRKRNHAYEPTKVGPPSIIIPPSPTATPSGTATPSATGTKPAPTATSTGTAAPAASATPTAAKPTASPTTTAK